MRSFSLLSFTSLVAVVLGAARTSPPSGALVVGKDSQYKTLQAAVKAVSKPNAVIFMQPGTYQEQVEIPKSVTGLKIYGYTDNDQDYSKNRVTLTHKLSAAEAGNNDASGTLRAAGTGLSVYNLNIINSFGKGSQAIALSAQASEQAYYGCQFIGYQDTILTNKGNHYFHACYIEGATDFIFGQQSVAWFERCSIGIKGPGYITANGRDSSSNPSFYVLNKATVSALSGVSSGATVLGRPWRTYARTVFQNSNLGSVVNGKGWSAWGSNPTDNVYYGEYANTGEGSKGTRVSWAKKLGKPVAMSELFKSTSWIDSSYAGI